MELFRAFWHVNGKKTVSLWSCGNGPGVEEWSHHGCTQQGPLLHRKDYLQGFEIPAVISPSQLVPIIATSPEPMAAARLGQMVTLSPRRLAEQPLRTFDLVPARVIKFGPSQGNQVWS
jgi:hypothetical protein